MIHTIRLVFVAQVMCKKDEIWTLMKKYFFRSLLYIYLLVQRDQPRPTKAFKNCLSGRLTVFIRQIRDKCKFFEDVIYFKGIFFFKFEKGVHRHSCREGNMKRSLVLWDAF